MKSNNQFPPVEDGFAEDFTEGAGDVVVGVDFVPIPILQNLDSFALIELFNPLTELAFLGLDRLMNIQPPIQPSGHDGVVPVP